MKKKLVYLSVLSALGINIPAHAADFANGGFEDGLSGWTEGGGTFNSSLSFPYILDPNDYLGVGTPTNTVITIGSTTTHAYDPVLASAGVNVEMVYNGLSSVRVNNDNNNKSISTISQTVNIYNGTSINLAWSAVLQYADNHGPADTDNFTILVEDLTAATSILSISYNASTAGSTFSSATTTNDGLVYYSGWRTETIATTIGNTYRISLLAADCNQGGHYGYVYLDAFGTSALESNFGGVAPSAILGSLPNIVVDNNATFNLLSNVGGTSFYNVFDGGTLKVDVNSTSAANFIITTNNGLIDQYGNAATFSGVFEDDTINGGLTVANTGTSGSGSITFSGTNTYTGTTTINSGATLALSGSGSIAQSSGVTNNGTFSVTAATGNVALGGTYTQSAGASLLMNFSAADNQQINVSDTATLAGNLAITASAGTYNVGRYTLITANGVSGTFNSFDGSSLSNLNADYSNYALGYDANNVYLNLYPTAANTQASIESNVAALRGAYNLANIAMSNNLNQDCSFFNEYGFCASLIGSHTSIAGSKDTDMTDGILVLAKKMGEHFRIGAYLDQTININNNTYVRLRNDGPGFGGFAVWNHQADGLGAQLRASAGHTSKDLSVTRQVVGNAEAGTGKTDFDSYGAAIVASYAVKATDNLNVTPYAGVRWTKVTADGYTEDSTAFAPLNFAALSQSATTLMGGLKVNKAINQKAAAYASFALEQDIHNNGGSYSASSANIAGITPLAFNQDINKVRPVVSAGTHYTIDRRQRIGADVIWSEQAFTKNDSTTLMVRYTLGL